MKKLFISMLALLISATIQAGDSPLWMRYCSISPDGKTIAFTYKGDIYTVLSTGGKATQLTTNPAHDMQPVWSPDGSKIAFASNRNGSFDIYIMDKEGGEPKQLTSHSANEYPETFTDNSHVLYLASILQDAKDGQFPSSLFPQVYKVSTEGGRPELYSTMTMQSISINKKGDKLLYQDMKGYEDPWRKHHTSSITRDIWLCTLDGNRAYKKITSFHGEDRNPVWSADGNIFYYLSEKNGSFNIYKADISGKNEKQLTNHTTHPVRFLSVDNNGTLCYGYDGEIYTVKEGAQPQKVNVQIISDKVESDLISRLLSEGATDIAVSPNGKEVAFIVHGDVYVTSVDYETTRQVTNTPQQERDLDFSPDGRSLVYSAERENTWGIYQTSLVRKDDKYFTYAPEIKEEPLVVTNETSFQPMYSPDGKEVSFLEDRTTLRVINLNTKQVRTVLDGKFNYSYADGDQQYQWSPDSRWFIVKYISVGGWNNSDIALVKADGSGEVTNLTESGYNDANAKWVLDGKAMIWQSDRAGYRSHGSWGSEDDVYIMFFDGEAYDKFRQSKEELALLEDEKSDSKDSSKDAKDKKEDKKKEDEKAKPVEPLTFDLENRKDRVIRLTINSSNLGDAVLTPKGDKLYYCAAFEKGYDLWMRDFKENTTKLLIKDVGAGSMFTDKKGENLFLVSKGQLKKVDIKDSKVEPIAFKAEFAYRPAKEREYIFHHIWRQVSDKFYDPKIHGIDWKGYEIAYEKFLPHVNNNFDFQEMLSEMLGELNGSHTGARYRPAPIAPATASLGAFFDNNYSGDGLKIEEIIAKGPLTLADSKITTGCIIEKIDGVAIKAGEDYYPLLKGKEGKKILLSVYNPSTKVRFDEQIKPVSYGNLSDLLYKRWVEQRRKMVDELSGGKIGYVHVKGMNSESFREVYSEVLGRCRNKEALIVDTRHNGGGWLHDDLATLLSGKEYQRFMPRGQYIGSDPYNKWLKPSCVLVCEDNYSNAHGFPWVYKHLGIGKLIGTPVPGTMTAVWWEQQIDPSIVFGIPQVGVQDLQGNYMENHELQPDIEVYNTPESQMKGEDMQLKVAVQEMLKTIGK
ncbi:S41 family peptidase [Parabacteroides chinchillae]|uniref:Tricorn protease homolog n=1 Tax=Parabacteroides chinchillae TaxID=871327 RepID=A0A8G2BXZ6_9BACT|nr:S41 family peptidase [Parabacteroides chinchillae]SEG11936.1 N-terminal domain of tricorn protease-containing protein [Parabacteroides chinchillae]